MIQIPASPIPESMSGVVHRALRAATRSDHAAIDLMLLPIDLSRADSYQIFLRIHRATLVTLQAIWRAEDGEDFEEMLRCVQTDLDILGCTTVALQPPLRAQSSLAEGLGISYVLRGSRLGAAVLRRRVGDGLPCSYLEYVPALSWSAFLKELESIADDPTGQEDAIRTARAAFSTFAIEYTRLQKTISSTRS